jgi:hypothetical protein
VEFTTEVTVEADDQYAAKVAAMTAVTRTITDALPESHMVRDFEWVDVQVRDD